MAEDTVTPLPEGPQDEAPVAPQDQPPAVVPELPPIATQEASTIGDENLEVREPEFEVNTESVPAQVMGQPAPAVTTVPVHETYVTTDTVITDTSDPLAVQIPDAGRGSLDLPIHGLSRPTVEQYFAAEAAKSDNS